MLTSHGCCNCFCSSCTHLVVHRRWRGRHIADPGGSRNPALLVVVVAGGDTRRWHYYTKPQQVLQGCRAARTLGVVVIGERLRKAAVRGRAADERRCSGIYYTTRGQESLMDFQGPIQGTIASRQCGRRLQRIVLPRRVLVASRCSGHRHIHVGQGTERRQATRIPRKQIRQG